MIVGNLTIDRISLEDYKSIVAMGGSSAYASLAARRLGARVGIVSKVGGDFPDEYVVLLSRNGINTEWLKRLPHLTTTRFLLRYGGETRTLTLLGRCEAIRREDVLGVESKAVHFGAVAGEVTANVVEYLSNRCEISSLDLQGFVRSFDEEGNVRVDRKVGEDVLSRVDVVKSSEEELTASTGVKDVLDAARKVSALGSSVVLVTRGGRGSLLLHGEKCYEVPAYEPRRVVDPTGAGDVFIGSFLAEYIKKKDPLWCSSVASASSSLAVEGVALSMGSRDDVADRASFVFRRIGEIS